MSDKEPVVQLDALERKRIMDGSLMFTMQNFIKLYALPGVRTCLMDKPWGGLRAREVLETYQRWIYGASRTSRVHDPVGHPPLLDTLNVKYTFPIGSSWRHWWRGHSQLWEAARFPCQ
eukprot:5010735-Amphidinium_carterae.1